MTTLQFFVPINGKVSSISPCRYQAKLILKNFSNRNIKDCHEKLFREIYNMDWLKLADGHFLDFRFNGGKCYFPEQYYRRFK